MNTKKTDRRTRMLNELVDTLKSRNIDKDLSKNRDINIKQCAYTSLMHKAVEMFQDYGGYVYDSAYTHAQNRLKLNDDGGTLMGSKLLPDFTLNIEGIKIAIEVNRSDTESDILGSIGQSIAYNSYYDFTIYLFIDASKDGQVKNAMDGENEKDLIDSLWENHNVIFQVV